MGNEKCTRSLYLTSISIYIVLLLQHGMYLFNLDKLDLRESHKDTHSTTYIRSPWTFVQKKRKNEKIIT